MLWILRRTGAVNFFNSFNRNCITRNGSSNNYKDKNVKRPRRKAYGRLSMDSDDGSIAKNNNNNLLECYEMTETKQYTKDMENNFNLSNYDQNNAQDMHNSRENAFKSQQAKIHENTINRLQAMAMSDDDDYDEILTCNVCDRGFQCQRQLASHQQKKRHFGCSSCDSLFPSLMLLEHHKEEFEHWSDEEDNHRICCRKNHGDFFSDSDSITSDAESEDMERLL